MLCRLSISNIAVIDKAEITLGDGFTVLTGETGAGKSLIMDAITMVLGGRMGKDIIRAGEKCAVAEAAFYGEHPLSDETDMLLFRRELYADGRNLCSINGNMVNVSGLRQAGESLLAVHGQHDTERLLHKGTHLEFVDAFAKTEDLRQIYGNLFEKRQAISAEIEKLETDDGEKLRRLDMLRFWIEEILEAAPVPGEEESLLEKREYLRHGEKIKLSAARGYSALCGEEGGARDYIAAAIKAIDGVSTVDPRLGKASETLRDILYQIEETADVFMDMGEEETDAKTLEEVEGRLDVLHKLKSKYGGSLEAVLSRLEEMQAEEEAIQTADQRLELFRKELSVTEKELAEAACALSEKRRQAGQEISARVEQEMAELDMEKVRFSVKITPKPYAKDGADEVEFFISTNPVEDLKPLAKIASGGELSRICLALQTVLAMHADVAPSTMIFDEIDTGISGRAAQRVGEKMRALAKNRQVLCVTHLPQMAAQADAQFKIEKQAKGEGFSTSVVPLDRAGRIQEIARMISGDNVTDKTLQTAEEMLR